MISTRLQKVELGHNKELIQEYNNVQIKEGDKWKAAFLMNKVLQPQLRAQVVLRQRLEKK